MLCIHVPWRRGRVSRGFAACLLEGYLRALEAGSPDGEFAIYGPVDLSVLTEEDRAMGERDRINMGLRDAPVPSLPKVAGQFFQSFMDEVNVAMPHPLDMDRFYKFVAACHQTSARILASRVESLLLERRFTPDAAQRFASIYEHGRKLLVAARAVPYERLRRRMSTTKR